MDDSAKLAALATTLLDDALSHFPVGSDAAATFRKLFMANDSNLVLELQSMMHEQSPQATWWDIKVLREMSESHTAASDLRTVGFKKTQVDAGAIAAAEFELVMNN